MQWQIQSQLTKKSPSERKEEVIKILLRNRGLKSPKNVREFLKPRHPQAITLTEVGINKRELKKAITRIRKAIKAKELIIVYGDYDADGVCAAAILWEALFSAGANVLPFIPDRETHGYGLSIKGIDAILKNPSLYALRSTPTLIMTVDNGIVAESGVDYAKKKGIDVVICDHHEKSKHLPKALAIIHTTKLAGSGVSWIFARELLTELTPKLPHRSSLDLATIGTVADMVPLLGANRAIVKEGLKELRETKRIGLRELFLEAQISPGEINTFHINFMIAPRLNAMGRLERATDALRLICTHNKQRAKELTERIGDTNRKRRKLLEETLLIAKTLYANIGKSEEQLIFIDHEEFHEGIIGLIAGKMVEEFAKPTIIVSRGQQLSKASARSVPGFNIIDRIRQFEDLLVDVGGHPMAAGFTIETKHIQVFARRMHQAARKHLGKKRQEKTLKVDSELAFSDITDGLYKKIQAFEPFGMANPVPVFVTKGVFPRSLRQVGADGKHLKLVVGPDRGNQPSADHWLSAIGFGMGEQIRALEGKRTIDIAFTIETNEWNGESTLQVKLKDVKPSEE
ncbi:MAG: single-stranded-DNA-specific exonuclease RecJ [Candidatus Chisholmbacteria bacterium RIFCSPLOWO2_01_FULL_50_28]|uniref:Single-stranded-DNA-specific exonuclease RecJ n=1 Tax=Candidatus Chisholmbacteria bacterium RIFCSPHIGHO2_01_FULL_52_32 TaxID=1797591 RepID=A0A1G1VTP9_9BACT|nr:MAG: single-stranded-DNA-specific exonuclease RecJ [Candidatus Chisholmbacteria bacterium RIFCSPHIGHO2_01_FULL_52_32]OGY19855.1 MAG: single-stranded-DNA-specific exonuclease RecJ [Candidatus Chisholmbacteria bacterium RIFCSPLOWO2_01_FULL_50_28]